MAVGVHAGAMMRAPPARLDRRLLGKHDAGATDAVLPEVHQVPVAEVAVDREILRHRAKHDAVLRGDAAHPERTEQKRALLDRGFQPPRMFSDNLDASNV